MVDKPVLIQVIALLCRDIEHARRLDIAVLITRDELRVHAQMAHTVRRDLLRQRDRHDLLRCRDEPARLVHDIENRVDAFLDHLQPRLIDDLVQYPVLLVNRILPGLHHLKQILKIPVFLERTFYLLRIFFI